jgi:hypothetical protein
LIVASKKLLTQSLRRLRDWAVEQGQTVLQGRSEDAISFVSDLVSDLGNTRGEGAAAVVEQRVTEMAALSIPFEVV